MNKEYEMVKEFHLRFNHPVAEKPTQLTKDRVKKRSKWMREEITEFENATTIEDQVDAIIDLIYFSLGTLVEMGVKPDEIFRIVHKANMSKFQQKAIYYEDGKVAKPEGWIPPQAEIRKAIERQKEEEKKEEETTNNPFLTMLGGFLIGYGLATYFAMNNKEKRAEKKQEENKKKGA